MLNVSGDQNSKTLWARLHAPWEKIDNDDPPTWRKSCGFFIAYITREEQEYTFELHGGNDEVLKEKVLAAGTLQQAETESNDLIAEFVRIGAGVLATNEIRVRQAFMVGTTIHGVGEDGVLYKYAPDGLWCAVSMTRYQPRQS